jgi:hypothetical protein
VGAAPRVATERGPDGVLRDGLDDQRNDIAWALALARRCMGSLFQSSLWVSPRVRAEAVTALDELFGA